MIRRCLGRFGAPLCMTMGPSIQANWISATKWTGIGSMLHNTPGHPPTDQWHGRAPGGARRCHVGTRRHPLWALPLLAMWMASRRYVFAPFYLFCSCKHNSPNTCGTKWNLNIKCHFMLDFMHFMANCWWQKRVLTTVNSHHRPSQRFLWSLQIFSHKGQAKDFTL
jgi:hypothetical protein